MSYAAPAKRCTQCRVPKPLTDFPPDRRRRDGRASHCRGCQAERNNRWRAANPEKARILPRESHWRALGLDFDYARYLALLAAQGGVCRICRRACPTGRALAVDHDHATGRVRGLLCMACNTGIGKFADDPARVTEAALYLLAHRLAGKVLENPE